MQGIAKFPKVENQEEGLELVDFQVEEKKEVNTIDTARCADQHLILHVSVLAMKKLSNCQLFQTIKN